MPLVGRDIWRKVIKRRTLPRLVIGIALGILFILSAGINLRVLFAQPAAAVDRKGSSSAVPSGAVKKEGDEQLAYLLVKLMLGTRREIAGDFTRKQSSVPAVDKLYRRLLVRNLILPAAVADRIFAETVPHATGERVHQTAPENQRIPGTNRNRLNVTTGKLGKRVTRHVKKPVTAQDDDEPIGMLVCVHRQIERAGAELEHRQAVLLIRAKQLRP